MLTDLVKDGTQCECRGDPLERDTLWWRLPSPPAAVLSRLGAGHKRMSARQSWHAFTPP